MEYILLFIGAVFGGILSWIITHWYYKKSVRENDKQISQLNKQIENLATSIPQKIFDNMDRFIMINGLTDEINENEIISDDNISHAIFKDINGDGHDELIIQFPVGTHGFGIQIYSISPEGITLLAEHGTDTPIEFDFEDIDHDGQFELKSIETNRSSGHPYSAGIRDVVWYKLINGNFVEIKREEPSENEIIEQLED